MTSNTNVLDRLVAIGHEIDIYEGSWDGVSKETVTAFVEEALEFFRNRDAWSDYEVALSVIAVNQGALDDELALLREEGYGHLNSFRYLDVERRQSRISGQISVVSEMLSRYSDIPSPSIQKDSLAWQRAVASIKRCRRFLDRVR